MYRNPLEEPCILRMSMVSLHQSTSQNSVAIVNVKVDAELKPLLKEDEK